MSKIRWIHFSDLHLNKTGTETKRLRKNLLIIWIVWMENLIMHSLQETSDMHQVEIFRRMLEKR